MSLAKRLQLKPGDKALVLHAPPGFLDALDVPPGAKVDTQALALDYDFVQVFVSSTADARVRIPQAVEAGRPDAVLFIAWSKGDAAGLSRDALLPILESWDVQPVADVRLDDGTTLLRLRPVE